MAYDKADILKKAKEAIKKHELTTINEVLCHIPCSESILYETEDWKLEVLEPIKKELDGMKVSLKAKMKRTWRKEDSAPALQIAAFKLMADDEELNVLNTSKVQQDINLKAGVTLIEGSSDDRDEPITD